MRIGSLNIIYFIFTIIASIIVLLGLIRATCSIESSTIKFPKIGSKFIQVSLNLNYYLYILIAWNMNHELIAQNPFVQLTFLCLIMAGIYIFNIIIPHWYQSIISILTVSFLLSIPYKYHAPINISSVVILFGIFITIAMFFHWAESKRLFIFITLMLYCLATLVLISVMSPVAIRLSELIYCFGFISLEVIFSYEYSYRLMKEKSLYETLKKEAKTDSLTGLKNFGKFNTDLEKMFISYKMEGQAYSFCEFDIDHFKEINDTYGHLVGNEVLKRTSVEIQNLIRETKNDIVPYRLGGEEFGLIRKLKKIDINQLVEFDELLRTRIGKLDFKSENGEKFKITISVGHDWVKETDHNYLSLYRRTDRYLYQSKVNGRNRININGKFLHEIA